MNIKDRFKEKIGRFFHKRRIILRDYSTGEESASIYISPLKVFYAFVGFTILLGGILILIIIYTPVLDTLPGYPGSRSREMLLNSIMRIDSLERQLSVWEEYQTSMEAIMDGEVPITLESTSDSTTVLTNLAITPRSRIDSTLRQQMEGESPYKLVSAQSSQRKIIETTFEMLPPTKGVITGKFNPKNGQLGIDIAAQPDQMVQSILEGTVTLATWTPNDGYIIQVQHAGNFLSLYKHNSRLLKQPGDRVRASEVIGFTGAPDKAGNPAMFHFELWYNGNPVDPENYILF